MLECVHALLAFNQGYRTRVKFRVRSLVEMKINIGFMKTRWASVALGQGTSHPREVVGCVYALLALTQRHRTRVGF